MDDERPTIYCFVSFPLGDDLFTEPALVSLPVAEELHGKGYMVVGPDPEGMAAQAQYDRAQRWMRGPQRRWFEAPD